MAFDVVNAVYAARLVNGRRLTNREKSVLARIADLVKGQLEKPKSDTRVASVSITQLAEELTLRREDAHCTVRGLIQLGCLCVVKKGSGRRSSTYHVPLAVLAHRSVPPTAGTLPIVPDQARSVPDQARSVPDQARSVPLMNGTIPTIPDLPREERAHSRAPSLTLPKKAGPPKPKSLRPGQTGACEPGAYDSTINSWRRNVG